MNKFISLLTFIYLISFSLHAENVSKIEVKGNKRFSVETIKVYGDIKVFNNFSKSDLDKTIKNLYETNFLKM